MIREENKTTGVSVSEFGSEGDDILSPPMQRPHTSQYCRNLMLSLNSATQVAPHTLKEN